MTQELPRRGKNSDAVQAAKEHAIAHERPTMPECPASMAPAAATGSHARISMGGVMSWPPPQVSPARDVLVVAIASLLLALVYLYW